MANTRNPTGGYASAGDARSARGHSAHWARVARLAKLSDKLSAARTRLGESRTGAGWARRHDALERLEAQIDALRKRLLND